MRTWKNRVDRGRKAAVGAVAAALVAAGSLTTAAHATPPDTAPTAVPMAVSAGVPDADALSIDVTADGPVEHVRDRPVTAEGLPPTIVFDESLQRHVADFAGDETLTSAGTGAYVSDISDAWSVDDPEHVE